MTTSAAPALLNKPRPPRTLPRFNVAVALDVTVMRAGIADRIPGRAVDISDRGLGLVVAGELFIGESVGVEFWLPRLEEPLKARALVRHHSQLRCGLEFLGLSAEQQALIQSWTRHRSENPLRSTVSAATDKKAGQRGQLTAKPEPRRVSRGIRVPKLRIVLLLLLAASLGWWRWQRGWKEIEAQIPAQQPVIQPQVMVPAAEMEQRITHKVDPIYPEAARQAHLHGVVVLHAIIGADGTVLRLEAVRGPEALAQAAMDAARWWRYEPYLLNGAAVEVETNVEVQFSDYRSSMTND